MSVVGTDGVNRVQVYSQEGQLLYAGPSGAIGTKYIYLHNHVIAEVGTSGTTYDHTDGLGSPVAQTSAAGTVLNRTRYEPYGYIAAGSARTIGFTGHVNDNDTGLVYMQQRYYDSHLGLLQYALKLIWDGFHGEYKNLLDRGIECTCGSGAVQF